MVMIEYQEAAVAAVVGILIISYYLYFIKTSRDHAHRPQPPPEAAGGWPLIGHLKIFSSDQPPYVTLGDMADKYGPIFRIRIGVHPAIVVSSSELAKELFTTHDVIVSSRPKYTAAKILGHNYANFGFGPYGNYCREMRKITASELLSTRRFELLRDIRDSEVELSMKEIYRRWLEEREGSRGLLLLEMKKWLGDMNLNVILRMVAGKRYSWKGGDEQQVRRIRWAFREFFRLTGVVVIGDAIPALGWVDFGGKIKEMEKAANEMDEIVSEWIEEHKENRDSGVRKSEQDFIDVLLSVLDGVDLAGHDTDTVNKATCLTLIAGATDTTTVTMTWTLSLLLNHGHVLKKVQDELDEKVGKERLVKESDMNKLTYLEAVVKESMRLYPAGPLSGLRIFTEDCTLGGYHIKQGTRLFLNLWKLHRDPHIWSDPLEFKPERFLSTHKDVDVKGQNFELLPFGGGRRSCPGITFGLQMTKLALAAFLHAFEVKTPSNDPVDMSATFGLTIIKTTPLEVFAKPRLSPSVYH
ncbi:hypothetical protein PIB30_025189 [Stylosanthes scabra]|uniref:Cytochrome P450 CYP82D47-like n=1 Tax=Stylosanthes scabra TaxID=79078 RepID=A0ABU6Z6Q5_9FABA|nr:hypothetical protein [Stylosanthes scabra]